MVSISSLAYSYLVNLHYPPYICLFLKNYYTKPHFKKVRPLHDDLLFMNLLYANLCVHVQSEVTWSE